MSWLSGLSATASPSASAAARTAALGKAPRGKRSVWSWAGVVANRK